MTAIQPTPPGVKTAWAQPEHMRLVRGLIEGWTDRPELVTRQRGQEQDDPWAAPAALRAGEDSGEVAA